MTRLALPLLSGMLTGLVVVACTVTDDKDALDSDSDVVDTIDTFDVVDTFDTVDTAPPDTDTDTDPRFDDTDEFGCPAGWSEDCNGICYALSLVGNGYCEHGPAPKPDFSCAAYQLDGGDCTGNEGDTDIVDTDDTDLQPCVIPGDIHDCAGTCVADVLLGDGQCDEAAQPPGANFNCPAFAFDNGDCAGDPVDTDADTDLIPIPCPNLDDRRDCKGACYYGGWIGDGSCDEGDPSPIGSPDFNCELHAFDGGDCPVP
ncbi:MAG: hypothetical protein H6732_17255 [Alphaproteobacteria bacterium]|nr:hypothetical protein [Alphaproteobacteria bacterium]